MPQKGCERYISHVMAYAFFKCREIQEFHFWFLFISDFGAFKGVRHNLKTHPRAVKTSAMTIFDVRSSKMKLLNRYNLWLISYKFYQNDGFLTL